MNVKFGFLDILFEFSVLCKVFVETIDLANLFFTVRH